MTNSTRTFRQQICVIASVCAMTLLTAPASFGQSVGLPAPRLLTTMPMGGTVGTETEITISGEHIEDADELYFSIPQITATRKLDASGKPEPNKYIVKIAADCPVGLCEARVMTRLGISSSRVFSVGTLSEVIQKNPNTALATAMELPVNSICNSVMTAKSIDYYSFEGKKGHRYVVDCACRGIDSKLEAVLIVADAEGRDLQVERRGGVVDFTAPADGKYVIKVHELTFKGGPAWYYRLALQELATDAVVTRLPSTSSVSSFSWPPQDAPAVALASETEPNGKSAEAQKITLPCDISGSFFPAADVDTFEFTAKKGEVWWIEVASERLGRPTDPAVLVQHVSGTGADEKLTDVAELSDIPSPVKTSSNGYAYDGPPYNAGSSDVMGKVEIQEDGTHRIQLTDLFGGTRSDDRNIYRLIVRKAAPDFAVVGWGLHMELRNGDRNALSKPLALRGGATMALEVVTVRRDGFDGEIELSMDGLPEGVTAQGLTIPAGKSRGIMLVTADQNAPRAIANVSFSGRAVINGQEVIHPCRMAAMAWPIPDAWHEIPSPRLVTDVPVSVSGSEFAPVTIVPAEKKVWEVTAGEKLTIPLTHIRRSEFSAATLQLKTFGEGFEQVPMFDVSLDTDASQAVLDLAALKTAPGDYRIAFYGGAVAKYRHRPDAVTAAEESHKKAEQAAADLAAELQKLTEQANAAAEEKKAESSMALEELTARHKAAVAAVAAAAEQVKAATEQAKPRDIVDIVVSEPITIRVNPAEAK